MNLLIISPCYKTGGGAVANILDLLLSRKTQYQIRASVLTFKDTLEQSDCDIIDDVTVYRALNVESINADTIFKLKWNVKKIVYLLKKTYLFITRPFPKYGFLERIKIKVLYNALKKIRLDEYDAVIAICGNFCIYESIRKLAEKRNVPPIVLYQVDPLSEFVIYTPKTKSIRQRYEKEMYARCAAVITTPIILKEKVNQGFALNNVYELNFPLVRDMSIYKPKEIKRQPGDIICLFAGNLFEIIRSPKYVLDLFSRIKDKRIKLCIIGDASEEILDKYKNGTLKGRLIRIPMVSLYDSLGYMMSADILLNIGNSVVNMIPSKIFDYISTGKPIINTYKSKECPTLEYLNKYENAISIYEDNTTIDIKAREVEEFIVKNHGKIIPYEQIEKIYKDCTVDYVAEKFFNIVKMTIVGATCDRPPNK